MKIIRKVCQSLKSSEDSKINANTKTDEVHRTLLFELLPALRFSAISAAFRGKTISAVSCPKAQDTCNRAKTTAR